MTAPRPLPRRLFLASLAATGASLTLGFSVVHAGRPERADHESLRPDLWLRIDDNGTVHVRVHKTEMGQGVLTALPMLVAEELGADWSRVRVEQADVDFRFADQNTSGSSSIIDSWTALRTAGATARELLLAAAGRRWDVPPDECRAARGLVVHEQTGRRVAFGDLVAIAATLEPPDPTRVRLKHSSEYTLIGRPTRRVDSPGKVTGRQRYGMDVRVPGMLYAVVTRSPAIGGRLVSLDAARALASPGVRRVVRLDADAPSRLPERVAVVADTTWAAIQGRSALDVEWDAGATAALSSASIDGELRAALARPPALARDDGWTAGADLGPRAVAAEYALPYLAHAPMEPINCTARVRGQHVELWAPTQFPQRVVEHVSRVTGLPREAITAHVVPMGGAFGRRVYPDFVVEAVQIATAVGAPVKTMWTREDDLHNDFFRPANLLRLSALIGADGRPHAWLHQIAGPSMVRQIFGTTMPAHAGEVGGAIDMPYDIAAVRVAYHMAEIPVPIGVWRSTSQSQNVFAVESFIDELAHRAGADPVAYRLSLLGGAPRLRRVLELASERGGWGEPLPAGRGRGVAINSYGDVFLAQVAEVAVDAARGIRVERIVCAVDCGQVINPLGARAQIEGGIAWGLGAALHGRITLRDGRIEQSNFHDYRPLRIGEMPGVEIVLVESDAAPGGLGEPGVSATAPAVANAIFAATGRRLRALPFGEELSAE